MTLAFRVDERNGILHWTAVGEDSQEDWDRIGLDAIQKLRSSPQLNMLVDHREHTPNLPTEYVRRVISRIAPPPADVQPKWAFVVSRDLAYGIARMASAYLEFKGFQTKVFTDLEQAQSWLKAP
jgi:hypothetical protein